MNPRLAQLHDYPFQRLAALLSGISPNPERTALNLSIGEPKHAPPPAVVEALADRSQLAADLVVYPATRGAADLREVICAWLRRRFGATVDPERGALPVAGTREALFSFAQAVVGAKARPVVAMPNPFYQIYEGAALLSGAEPHYVPAEQSNAYQPDFESIPNEVWKRMEVLYLCSPGNPTGKVLPAATQRWLIEQAHRFDFIIAADECYAEIHRDESAPPTSLLQESEAMGNKGFERCVAFHSLSKRSSLPGLRSGFVAGDAEVLKHYCLYRTYQGCAMPAHVQKASILAWCDNAYASSNRARYQAKCEAAATLLETTAPEGGFHLWLATAEDDRAFAQALYRDLNIRVLPGTFLGRTVEQRNPGAGHVRISLVAAEDECLEAIRLLAAWQRQRS